MRRAFCIHLDRVSPSRRVSRPQRHPPTLAELRRHGCCRRNHRKLVWLCVDAGLVHGIAAVVLEHGIVVLVHVEPGTLGLADVEPGTVVVGLADAVGIGCSGTIVGSRTLASTPSRIGVCTPLGQHRRCRGPCRLARPQHLVLPTR